ncbi:hypothetical protein APY03_7009 [Variovorax sp. WDL1]|nr:hypothetical protein APY03_7009 [Variovorax sp. WDL1]
MGVLSLLRWGLGSTDDCSGASQANSTRARGAGPGQVALYTAAVQQQAREVGQ